MEHGALRHLSRTIRQRAILRKHSTNTSSSLDNKEVEKFRELSSQWADEFGPFKALHSLNQLRVPWILQNIGENKEIHILDMGSGGGLLSVPLARAGLRVTGLDATEKAVAAAREVLMSPPLKVSGVSERISYHVGTVEEFAEENENAFDAVVASEILEHVADLNSFVSACARLAKPNAHLFFTTINKTVLSWITAVWLAENVLGIVPPGVHDWEKFVKPDHLARILKDNDCSIRLSFVF
uniref:Methyltransf_11 domain-containing protein n=1 Tax=Heterorhabditis bacteriophora TaxID=37862 RepID=A0A1I7XR37_HETBA